MAEHDIRYWGDADAVYMSLDALRNMARFAHPWRSVEAYRTIEKWCEEAERTGCLELTEYHIECFRDWEQKEPGEKRRYIPRAVRRAVIERDGGTGQQCGSTENISLDHKKPYSLGGRHSRSNLQVLCRSCNSRKGARVR
jgi:hypothetical protein